MSAYTSGKVSHDPHPYINGYGSRFDREALYLGGLRLTNHYAPRPEFDNHNPILAEFRKGVTVDPERDWTEIFLSTLPEWDSGEVGHARRVLSKLAALTTTTNGVTD